MALSVAATIRKTRCLSNVRYFGALGTNLQRGLVTKAQQDEFEENGVICLRNVFNQHWLKTVEKGIHQNILSPSLHCDWLTNEKDGKSLFFNDYFNFNNIYEYNSYVRESPVTEIAQEITNSKKMGLFHEHVFYKDKGSMRETPWHHDQAYYPFDGNKNCSIWMPTRQVSKSCSLKFIKGSHHINKWFVPRLFKSNENYIDIDELPQEEREKAHDIREVVDGVKDKDILQWHLQPGDCLVFHMKTIHGTDSSFSNQKRIVISTRWLGEDITYCQRPWPTSPPKEFLPKDLNFDDFIVENKHFMGQVKKMYNDGEEDKLYNRLSS
ncbi:uncharacterized protein [Clytia hemisphaerica]|uniref:Phytanoyl-CoA dioxygenase n=1 Tax=Clytia hemisphaerica TaxID=252671 RepID=A0A7M5VE96_9CNID